MQRGAGEWDAKQREPRVSGLCGGAESSGEEQVP